MLLPDASHRFTPTQISRPGAGNDWGCFSFRSRVGTLGKLLVAGCSGQWQAREVVMTVVTSTGTVTVNAAFLQEIKEVNQELWSLLADLRHRCQRPIAPSQCRLLIDKLCQLRDQLALHF